MIKKILQAASWLSLVQVMNLISISLLSILVIRQTSADQVSIYMYAVFITDAVMSYTLLQISQRIILAKDDTSFKQLFAYSRVFGVINASLAVSVVAICIFFSKHSTSSQMIEFVAWLTVGNLANYFAQILFSTCDYNFDYKSFGISSALSNILSLFVAVIMFALGGGVFSMVMRDVTRGFILLALAFYSVRALIPQLRGVPPLDRKSRFAFFGFLIKRHALKVIEVSNHRVPALVMSSGNINSLGQFGVAFQMISQIMGVLTIVGDKLAYSFFSRGEGSSKLKYLAVVMAIYACVGLIIILLGEPLFLVIYGEKWSDSAKIFSLLGLYLFTHGTLVVVTNYLITQQRFIGVYFSWIGWTATFFFCYMYSNSWPIVSYYLMASAASCVIVLSAWVFTQYGSFYSRSPKNY